MESGKWKSCRDLAIQIAKDLDLDYYKEDTENRLSLSESLFMIHRKAKLGAGIPDSLQKYPWLIPEDEIVGGKSSSFETINAVLKKSMRIQMGSIPETVEFRCFILSQSPKVVTCLLFRYFRALKVAENVHIQSGLLQFSKQAGSDAVPHIWLETKRKKRPLDNAFVYIPMSATNPNSNPVFFRMKDESLYVNDEDPSTTSRRLFTDNTTAEESNLKLYNVLSQTSGAEDYISKFLVMVLSVSPRAKLYDILMRDYLQKEFNTVLELLESSWNEICWMCRKKSSELKRCQQCKVAKYCGKFCQKAEWKFHKLLHSEALILQSMQ